MDFIADGEIHDLDEHYKYILLFFNCPACIEQTKKMYLEKYIKYILDNNISKSEFSFIHRKNGEINLLQPKESFGMKFKI